MGKKMVYFNATKQIETITIHYNEKLDGTFVNEVAQHIKDIAKRIKGIDLKKPREFDAIQVFVYPSQKLFYKVFAGEIEKRFYNRRRSLEDLYLVMDSEGNIHIVSPRGMSAEKIEAFKKILVMKILGEYMNEKEKNSAERLLKEALKPKKEEKEQEDDEKEDSEDEIEEPKDEEEALEEIDQDEEELIEEELDEEELKELIEAEAAIEEIDEAREELDEEENDKKEEVAKLDEESEDIKSQKKEDVEVQEDEVAKNESKEDKEEIKSSTSSAQEWLSVGWLAYVRGKLKTAKDIKKFAEHVSKNGVKKLSKLTDTKIFESYNYSEEYACALVTYIIETYGMDKFIEFYSSPKDIERVFGISERAFNSDVKAYVYCKYTVSEMKMEMDQRDLPEITEIRLYESGGAEINENVKERSTLETLEISHP